MDVLRQARENKALSRPAPTSALLLILLLFLLLPDLNVLLGGFDEDLLPAHLADADRVVQGIKQVLCGEEPELLGGKPASEPGEVRGFEILQREALSKEKIYISADPARRNFF